MITKRTSLQQRTVLNQATSFQEWEGNNTKLFLHTFLINTELSEKLRQTQ